MKPQWNVVDRLKVLYLALVTTITFTTFSVHASDIIDCITMKHGPSDKPNTVLQDPAEYGEFEFTTMHYGPKPFLLDFSSLDIISTNIDLPDFLSEYSRNQGYEHDAYHDFDQNDVALKAKLWLPMSTSAKPLVFLVHGNSPPGFNYLGDLLASRGYAVVKIDQTYLNGLWGENGARGWILLEHIKLLKKWNTQPENLLQGMLDFDKIALIGMSRGGEAVALAASFNQLKTVPNTNKPTGFGFNIQSVITLAPMDGQYEHSYGKNVLKNTNYMVLQGGHDADVYQFLGSQQWQRTYFLDDKEYLKQSIYIYRANHINFNQDMSDDFHWGRQKQFYEKLQTPEQQETLTKVFVSSFLEVTLNGKEQYREILSRPRSGIFNIPKDIYVSRYVSSDFQPIENFEAYSTGNFGLSSNYRSAEVEGSSNIVAERLRNGSETPNHVLHLKLNSQKETVLTFNIPKETLLRFAQNDNPALSFSIARADSGISQDCSTYNILMDTSVALRDSSGNSVSFDLAGIGNVAPLLLSDYSELERGGFSYAPTEPLLQTVEIPLDKFQQIDSTNSVELLFKFTPTQDITLYLDDIGLTSRF